MYVSTYNSFETRDQTNAVRYHEFLSGAPVDADNYEVITALKQDDANHLWIANYYAADGNQLIAAPYLENGFVSTNKEDWVYFKLSSFDFSEGNSISCFDFDQRGWIWMGTFSNGVYALDYNNTLDYKNDDKLYHFTSSGDNLFTNSILSIAVDHDGVVWIGTSAGLNSYDGVNVYKHIGDESGLTGPLENRINFIFIDAFNNRWFATPAGLSILRADKSPWDPNGWIGYTKQNSGLICDEVHCVYVNSKTSEALIGTEEGLSVYSGTFAQIHSDYLSVKGGPNPFILNNQNINYTFTNLMKNSFVKIYTLNGILVRELSPENGYVDGGRALWNGKDYSGQYVSTGIYLYAAYNADGNSVAGKIAVIKK
jgi:ligand-binding sensor domain-containing protein